VATESIPIAPSALSNGRTPARTGTLSSTVLERAAIARMTAAKPNNLSCCRSSPFDRRKRRTIETAASAISAAQAGKK